jgi:hypothetical protein
MIRILSGTWLGIMVVGIALVFPYKEDEETKKLKREFTPSNSEEE